MKFRRIVSFALAFVMLSASVFAMLPVTASAAYSETDVSGTSLSSDEIAELVKTIASYSYETSEALLVAEQEKGYLSSVTYKSGDGTPLYTLYVNRYTGYLYYKSEKTGQILTSNPIDVKGISEGNEKSRILSQIVLAYTEITTGNSKTYYSKTDAAERAQISVAAIKNGLRVNYTLGNTASRYLLPGMITAESMEENILIPLLTAYQELLEEHCRAENPKADFDFFDGYTYRGEAYDPYLYGCISRDALEAYLNGTKTFAQTNEELKNLNNNLRLIFVTENCYTLKNPAEYKAYIAQGKEFYVEDLQKMYENYPVTANGENGTAIYVLKSDLLSGLRANYAKVIQAYCPEYTFSDLYADEREVGYVAEVEENAVFRLALEYSFADDGSLMVRLPANSISYDTTLYHLDSISSLPAFGAGDMDGKDGYIFLPDGSGTIIDFEDFYNSAKKTNLSMTASVYGQDFAFSTISGQHREQVTLPVFGLVNEVKAGSSVTTGAETVMNGYFAVIEEGSALSALTVYSGGAFHKYAMVYNEFSPFPSDEYDLSEVISVGASGSYTMVADTHYTGSFVTRYRMLNDDGVIAAEALAGDDAVYYPATYVGMAAYYRNLLCENGILTALTPDTEDIPLYIESFGAMQIQDKFLTFPITKTVALTSFNDVITMYGELSAAGIKNVNFKLTGFSNGGMAYTYPTKVKWERAVGGTDGFKNLVAQANKVSSTAGAHLGIYPDFDFQYINETAIFDGVSLGRHVSRMIDNRYASKQIYDSISGEFESFYNMVVSAEVLETLYTKFSSRYAKYGAKTLSVSTLGSDLNSDMNEDAPVNREEALSRVESVLAKMKEDGYEIMTDIGNAYTLAYVKHLTEVSVDSSHFSKSSYAVPFTGMVLHGYINYAGTPLNYSGTVDYDILRLIENGAYPAYILCYQNTAHLKEDEDLSQYFGVSYENWFSDVKKTYELLNTQLRDLQTYAIVDHRTLIGEMVIDAEEAAQNAANLAAEAVAQLKAQLSDAIDRAYAQMREDPANNGRGIRLTVDTDAILALLKTQLGTDTLGEALTGEINGVVAEYTAAYDGTVSDDPYDLVFTMAAYESSYHYTTDSDATLSASDYAFTDYTVDNNNIVLVTYSDGTHTVRFILNYNVYAVNVSYNGVTYSLAKYGFQRIG